MREETAFVQSFALNTVYPAINCLAGFLRLRIDRRQ